VLSPLAIMENEDVVNHRAALPEKYVYVSANPNYNHILYCLPRHTIGVLASPSSLSAPALRPLVVVVKVRPRPLIHREHAALLAIENATRPDSAAKKHFLHALDVSGLAGPSEESLASLTLPAVLPSVTLSDWQVAACTTENPIALVYHVFVSLGTALRFLRRECVLEHGDVHEGNVLLRVHSDSPFGLPELVLIDFEAQRVVEQEVSRDYFGFLAIVRELAYGAEDGVSEAGTDWGWSGFKQDVALALMHGDARAKRRLEVSRFEELWGRWENAAVEGRGKVSKEAVAVTRELFEKAAVQRGECATDEELRMAVDSVR
jgi:hypothetical protein